MTRLFAGASRAELPPPDPRAEMLGWGQPDGRCAQVHTPLEVRALVLSSDDDAPPIVLVVHELCMVAGTVREAVLRRLQAAFPAAGFSEHTLLIGANHTHAGPGGYTTELFYSLANPGFDAAWFEALVATTTAVISAAWSGRAPAELHVGTGTFDASDRIAQNRSPASYRANRSHLPEVVLDTALLSVRHVDGTPLACVDWFGVHGTCVHADQRIVHPDNKGMAARVLEATAADALGAPDFVALFFQGAAGDVTPNTRYDRDRRRVVGELASDVDHAERHGSIQAAVARRTLDTPGHTVSGTLDGALLYIDFDGQPVDADLADGRPRRTAHGLVGLPFLYGTAEGPGPLRPVRTLGAAGTRLFGMVRSVTGQGTKLPFCEVGRGRFGKAFGAFRMSPPALPGLDPVVDVVSHLTEVGGIGDTPWIANRQPVQVLRIGSLAIVSVSGEPTTHAGRLLVQTATRALREAGVEQVLLCGYANAFSGYITTAPEYRVQDYEGGHTLYGPWTLAGWRTGLRRVARRLTVPVEERPLDPGPRPLRLPPEVLALRAFPCSGPGESS